MFKLSKTQILLTLLAKVKSELIPERNSGVNTESNCPLPYVPQRSKIWILTPYNQAHLGPGFWLYVSHVA